MVASHDELGEGQQRGGLLESAKRRDNGNQETAGRYKDSASIARPVAVPPHASPVHGSPFDRALDVDGSTVLQMDRAPEQGERGHVAKAVPRTERRNGLERLFDVILSRRSERPHPSEGRVQSRVTQPARGEPVIQRIRGGKRGVSVRIGESGELSHAPSLAVARGIRPCPPQLWPNSGEREARARPVSEGTQAAGRARRARPNHLGVKGMGRFLREKGARNVHPRVADRRWVRPRLSVLGLRVTAGAGSGSRAGNAGAALREPRA